MEKAKTIAQYIRQFVNRKGLSLLPYLTSGRLNNEYIRGNQHKKINTQKLTIEDQRNNEGVYLERKIFNRLLPLYQTRYGILSNNMPIAGFKPQSNTSKEVYDSQQGNAFLRYYTTDTDWKKAYGKLVQYADVYGIAWVKTGIDWSQGKAILDIEESKTINNKTVKGTKTLYEGRPFIEVCPIDEVFPDTMYADDMGGINELVHRRVMSVDMIRRKFGIEAKAEEIRALSLASAPLYTDVAQRSTDDPNYAYVYEYYKKPDAMYPQGRYTLTINDNVLYDGVLPYQNSANNQRIIPFDFVKLQTIPNYLVGVTVYSQLIPMQDTYNSVKNRFLEYMNHLAIGQLYYWEGSITNINTFTNKPGKLVSLKRGARKPEPITKDKIGNEFINYLRLLEEDMLVTAGISQLTAYGQAKSSMRTDGVIDKIAESDENKLVNAIDNLCQAITSIFKKVIYCEKQRETFLMEELKLAKHDEYILKYKLQSVDAETVTIINREFLMQSDQVREKKLQQLQQLGVYNPELGLSYVSKLELIQATESGYLQETLDPVERATHDLVAEEHTELIEDKIIPKAEPWHIHQQHVFEHNLFRISPEIRKLKHEDEDKWKLLMEAIDEHIKLHQNYQGEEQKSTQYQQDAKALMQ